MRGASIRSSSTGNPNALRDGRTIALSGSFLTCISAAFEGDLAIVLVATGLLLAFAGLAFWLSSPRPIPSQGEHHGMTLLDWACMHGPARHGGDAA